MRIGIDIDGVLTNIEQFCIDYLTKYCVENNIDFNISGSNYQIAKAFNISNEDENNFWQKYMMYYATQEKARPFASEIIKTLKEAGHEIYIITARWLTNRDDDMGNKMRHAVKSWLSENDIIYDKLIFAKSSNEQKVQEITDYNIDLMIEDSPNNVTNLSKIIPVICYHAGYNANCVGKNITRCYSWYDIYNTIQTMTNKL